VPLAAALHLSVGLLLVLAAAGPGAGLLALARGRLYGAGRTGGVTASLLAEPLGRLAFGTVLTALLGPVGGAAGVVAAGYCALGIARWRGARVQPPEPAAATGANRQPAAMIVFLLLAVLANQDLLWANALLGRDQAALFAVLSTLGGVAAFATATIPMVLLPRAAQRDAGAVLVALSGAAAVGIGALLVVAVTPTGFWVSTLGPAYAGTGRLGLAYLAAMAMFGLARVLAAENCVTAGGRATGIAVGITAAGQAIGITIFHHDARSIALVTLAAMTALTMSVGTVTMLRARPAPLASMWLLRPRPVTATHIRWAVAGLTVLGIVVRLLSPHSIWVDEAISIRQARLFPFQESIRALRDTDVHPPLFATVLWLQVHLFGTSQFAVRLPSIVTGSLLVPMLYLAGRDLYNRRAGLAAAALGVFAPFAVWYSQETRMYPLFLLFGVTATWAQARVLKAGGRGAWVVYTLASAALLWTHYFATLQVITQQIVFAVIVWRRHGTRRTSRDGPGILVPWLASLAALTLLAAPLVPFASAQLHAYGTRGGVGFAAQAGDTVATGGHPLLSIYSIGANGVWAVWGYHSDAIVATLVAVWPVGMLVAFLLLGRGWSRSSLLLAATVLVPVLCLFALGTRKENLFEVRYFVGILPGLMLLAGRALTSWLRTTPGMLLGVGLATLTLVVALVDQQLNPSDPRLYDFDGALKHVTAHAQPGDIIVYTPIYLVDVVDYYAPGLPSYGPGPGVLARARSARHVFVVGSFLSDPNVAVDTGALLARLELSRRVVNTFHAPQVIVWELQ
ncbi:glycosyltransferase family 39 protein, partial [Frankia sp. Cj3]|uniref:glycosyltransferase family 39 protein n=2 Tax=Frankia sp. Cj3 TaxID=2880976 RepID=UPI001EF3E13C